MGEWKMYLDYPSFEPGKVEGPPAGALYHLLRGPGPSTSPLSSRQEMWARAGATRPVETEAIRVDRAGRGGGGWGGRQVISLSLGSDVSDMFGLSAFDADYKE